MGKLTDNCRDVLVDKISSELDTRDKRFMFLRMEFSRLVSRIDIEGSSYHAAWNIFSEFEKQSMLGSLIAVMNAKLDTGIELEIQD